MRNIRHDGQHSIQLMAHIKAKSNSDLEKYAKNALHNLKSLAMYVASHLNFHGEMFMDKRQ